MQAIHSILAIPVLLALALPAQQPGPQFRPGEWEINSINTVMGSRDISSQTRLCAKEQMDFWKVAQAGLTCKPPQSHPMTGGLHVKLHCTYSQGPLHSEIHSDVVETLAHDGNSFTLDGTSTTETVYQGVQPKQTSTHLHASAQRVGDCPR
jgi:hypothetical protein